MVLFTMYGHMLDDSIVVNVGDKVMKKQKIGTIGSTGRSTGIHCHFMISVDKLSFKQEDFLFIYITLFSCYGACWYNSILVYN